MSQISLRRYHVDNRNGLASDERLRYRESQADPSRNAITFPRVCSFALILSHLIDNTMIESSQNDQLYRRKLQEYDDIVGRHATWFTAHLRRCCTARQNWSAALSPRHQDPSSFVSPVTKVTRYLQGMHLAISSLQISFLLKIFRFKICAKLFLACTMHSPARPYWLCCLWNYLWKKLNQMEKIL